MEFDEQTRDYYIVWRPIVIGSGRTKREALLDLREAAHLGVDTMIESKLKDSQEGGDING